MDFGHPLLSQLLTSLCTCFRTGSCSPAPLMVTGQPLLIVWEICPSMSLRMKISLVSWIVSTETDPKARGESPPGTSSWFLHHLTRFILNQLKASLKHLTFKTVFLLTLGSGKRRSEIHAWQNRNIRHQSNKSDRSLCPVIALHYYLDRTSDLRQNKEVGFVSFKKGFDKTSHLPLSPLGSSRL